MEQERKGSAPTAAGGKSQAKTQQRLQEHNYTNVPGKEGASQRAETAGETPEAGESQKGRNAGGSRVERTWNAGQRHSGGQPSSSERHHLEAKSKAMKKDVFNRIRRSEEELQKAAEMVRGGMTFQTASDTFNIPISTIRFYMARRGILPQRRRGRGSSGVRDDDLIHPPFEIIHYRLPDIDKPL